MFAPVCLACQAYQRKKAREAQNKDLDFKQTEEVRAEAPPHRMGTTDRAHGHGVAWALLLP